MEKSCNFPDDEEDEDNLSRCLTDDSFDALRTHALTLYPFSRSCFTIWDAKYPLAPVIMTVRMGDGALMAAAVLKKKVTTAMIGTNKSQRIRIISYEVLSSPYIALRHHTSYLLISLSERDRE